MLALRPDPLRLGAPRRRYAKVHPAGEWVTVSRPIGGVLSTGPLRGSGWVTIHLCGLPGSVSGRAALSLFGLAPDGVCLAGQVTPAAGALLPHRFTLTCARSRGAGPSAVCSLWHFPAGRPDWPLASILPCGAPTFLSEFPGWGRRRDHPAGSPSTPVWREGGPGATGISLASLHDSMVQLGLAWNVRPD